MFLIKVDAHLQVAKGIIKCLTFTRVHVGSFLRISSSCTQYTILPKSVQNVNTAYCQWCIYNGVVLYVDHFTLMSIHRTRIYAIEST